MGYIYQITDIKTRHYYVGRSQNTNPETDNYWGSGLNRICRAAKKHNGADGRYQKTILINGISCHDRLCKMEDVIIGDRYETDEYCLNLMCGGVGGRVSPEARAKISIALMGKKKSEATKAKLSSAATGKLQSAEHKAKNSASQKGKTHSAATKERMSASRKEWHRRRREARLVSN